MSKPRPAGTSSARRFHRDVDGILLLDKPLGVSSNAALQQARVLFSAVKAGHAGSLDPLASGLLPVCFGQATKVCGRLLNSAKTYRVLVQLGERTESGDLETAVCERAPVPALSLEGVDRVLATFLGAQVQVPPMHSALKFEGKRLYELARQGLSVERMPRAIVIHRLERVSLGSDQLEVDVDCSKGTYIRTLAADLAVALGTLGHVKGLRRLSVDPFAGRPMWTLEELAACPADERPGRLLPADTAFGDLTAVQLDEVSERNLLLGQAVRVAEQAGPGEHRAYGPGGRFLGLVEAQPESRVRPVRLFVPVPPAA